MDIDIILLSELNQENIEANINLISQNPEVTSNFRMNIDYNRLKTVLHMDDRTSFFVKRNDSIIGVFLSSIAADSEQCAYIILIYVLPKFRHMGLGKVILEHGISLLQQRGCYNITLEVLSTNTGALSLYNQMGFCLDDKILSFRNENCSFYSINSDVSIKSMNSLLLRPTMSRFNKKYIWHKDNSYFITLIDSNLAEFYLIKQDSKTIGYFIVSRNLNALNILDFAIIQQNQDCFFQGLSQALHNEKIVTTQTYASQISDCEMLKKNGFFVETTFYSQVLKLV